VVGPPAVALAADEGERRDTYAAAWWLRAGVWAIVTPAAVVLSVMLSPPGTGWLAALVCVSAALSGMSMTWYAIGVGRARLITAFEVVPRMAALASGAGLVAVTGQPLWYPACTIVGILLAQLAFHRHRFSRIVPLWPGAEALRAATYRSAPGAGVLILAGVRASAPVPVSTLVDGGVGVVPLSSADRLFRYSLFSVSALGDALQNWVLEGEGGRRRQGVAVALHVALGVTGAVGLALLGPWCTPQFCVGYAVAFFFVSAGTPLVRNVLVPRASTRLVLISDVVGLLCGAGAGVALVVGLGAVGIPWALAVAEGTSLLGYVVSVIATRRPRSAG
jgi:PST family polysaccharide transporter